MYPLFGSSHQNLIPDSNCRLILVTVEVKLHSMNCKQHLTPDKTRLQQVTYIHRLQWLILYYYVDYRKMAITSCYLDPG